MSIDTRDMTISDSLGKDFVAFTFPHIEKYYKLPKNQVDLIKGWYHNFSLSTKDILKS